MSAKICSTAFPQAERTAIALQRQHPELVNVWDDVGSLPTVEPQQGEQPADLKVTLLPFQRESLYWMREQEKGAWSGGMLAVMSSSIAYFP